MARWGFLTNHAHVLIHVARHPRSTVREIARVTGITERAAISVLHDLRQGDIVSSHREGRQNVYRVNLDALARHRPWGASAMEIPEELIRTTVRALERLAAQPTGRTPRAKASASRT